MVEAPKTKGYRGKDVLSRLGVTVAALVAILACLDVVLRVAAPASGIFQTTIDVQSPAALYAKLEEFRKFDGVKVAVLGDSLIFGRAMRDKGDTAWQAHTLSSQLQNWLAEKHPGQKVLVANFGMNGTLPTDLENLVRIVLPSKPDAIVFDLSLRSFSRDFDREGETRTRLWLDTLSVDANGTYSTGKGTSGITGWSHDALVNWWFLYRSRDFLQALWFDGSPFNFLMGLRDAADKRLQGSTGATGDELGDVVLLMRARARYEKIDLAPDNPQRQALDRILRRVSEAKQPTLIFYATENPKVLPDLLPQQKFAELQAQLVQIISPRPPDRVYVGPLATLPASEFLDHVHLDKAGYAQLSAELGPPLDAMIGRR
ncbi:hypothetical protein GPL21_18610 [Bradyrhizobium pachyrhizi]|uniref:Uncharacterized protein n=1 Tax=Bradyrhizobium pachyrhizi TaxID=280333 RepID=A0A844SNS7_9BRAD|nr:hypothetical protein [Bradyrhizobium pachyrhizi]MVT67115.1 hypothetical protein [Bradyrhizobium pachyrhizi]WFU53793.1 hypothetical protein QA639_29615 [Bradyrhizobium pachyrhizi]